VTLGDNHQKSAEPDSADGCQNPEMTTAGCGTLDAAPARGARTGVKSGGYLDIDPDGDLVTRWKAGDESAFESLIKRHEGRVFGLLMRMLGNREDAEDVAQETFISLHRHGHRFRHDARFSTFVYRVAANAALNRRRTLGRKNARLRKLQTRQAAGDDLPTTSRDPESAAFGTQVQARVQDALLQLPPDLRAATVLYDIEGLSYREIAAVLNIPEGTVKSRIHRARGALRDRLKGLVSNEDKGERK
jgi:RNA polymerase sigma-70 factor (ECF subfamily)